MNLETLVLELVADDSKLSRDIDAAVNKATKKLASLENVTLAPNVDFDSLHELNKILDVKQRHLKETVRVFKTNVIEIKVDKSEVDEAKQSLKELREERDKSERQRSQGGGQKQSRQQGGDYDSGTLYNEIESKIVSQIEGAIGKVGSVITAPLAGIGRGFFEGFGQVASKELSKGFMKTFDKDLNINLKDAGKKAADATIQYAFPSVKNKKQEKARVKQYKERMAEVDELLSGISNVAASSSGLSQEKDTIGNLKTQSAKIKENLKSIETSIGAQGIPTNEEVLAMGIQVNAQIDAIAKLSASVGAVSEQIGVKLKKYRDANKMVSDLSNRLDVAVNSNDYKAIRQIKNDISSQLKSIGDVGNDPVLSGYRDQLIGYQRSAKVDSRIIARTSDNPTMRDYLLHPKSSMELMAEKGQAQLGNIGNAVKNELGGVLVEGAKFGARSAISVGRGVYGALDAAESLALGPAKHVVKPIIQGTAIAAGLPMIASASPAFAPVAGALQGLGGIGGGALANALGGSMGALSNIPVVGGQLTTVGTQLVTTFGSFVTEMLAAGVALNTLSGGVDKLFKDSLLTNAIAPAKEQPKTIQAAQKGVSKLIEKAQNLDAYLPTLPESQRKLIREYLPKAASIEQANKGDFIPQSVALPGLKQLKPADFKQLDAITQSNVKSDWENQYQAAQKVLFEFMGKMRGTIDPLDRMKGDIASLSSAFKAQVKRLEKQGKQLGFDVSKHKMDESAFKGVTLDADAVAMPDVSKLKRDAKESAQNIGDGIKLGTQQSSSQAGMAMVELAEIQQDAYDKTMGIESPSKWAMERMRFIAEGFRNGAKSFKSWVMGDGEDMAESFISGFDNEFDGFDPFEDTDVTGFDPSVIETDRRAHFERLKQRDMARTSQLPQLPPIYDDEREKHFNRLQNVDNELNIINSNFSREFADLGSKTGDIVSVGTEEYYDNFLGGIRDTLLEKLKLKGTAGESLIDQIMTFVVAGATTFAPGLAPAVAVAPLMMPLIPAAMASLGIGTLIAPIVQRIDQALMQQEPIKQRFTTLEGTPAAGQVKQAEITSIAEKYSIPIEPAVQNFSQMAIAAQNTNLTAREMVDLFEGISASIRALGLSTQDADLIFMAYTQMLSKGKISMEELRQQLGERFPPAMSVFAKALNTTTAGLDEMVSRGSIGTEQWVGSVTKVLKEDFGTAALAMGDNYASVTTKIENLNFKLNKNFADTYGGLFTAVKSAWGNILSLVNDNFQILNALAVSGLIAVWASIGIGISYIMKTPAIANMAKGGSNLLFSVFKNTLGTLTPFLIGTIADVMDDVLGADNSVMENMSKGIGNMFVAAFTGIDRYMKDADMGAMFDPFIDRTNPFSPIINGLKDLVKVIPTGIIEMTALVLMFEQVRVLGNMFVMPTLTGMAQAFGRWGKSIKDAVANANTMQRTIGDLFGGTLIALGGVSEKDALKRYSGEFKALSAEFREANNQSSSRSFRQNLLNQYDAERWGIINDYVRANNPNGFNNADEAKQARTAAKEAKKAELMELKRQYQADLQLDPNQDGLVKYEDRRNALLNSKMKKMAAQRLLMGGAMIAAEAGFALAVMAFARSDFSNNIEAESNKARVAFVGAVDAMKASLKDLEKQGAETAETLTTVKLPSKGLELNLEAIFFGRSEKSFKSDDLILKNRERTAQLIKEYEKLKKVAEETKNPLRALYAELVKPLSVVSNKDRIDASRRFGVESYYPQIEGLRATLAEEQLLDTLIRFSEEYDNVMTKLRKDNATFNIDDLSQPLSQSALNTLNQLKALDEEIALTQEKRTKLGLENTASARDEIRSTDKKLNDLLKIRKELAKPFVELDAFTKDLDAYIEAQVSAIENSGYPLAVQLKLKEQLQPVKDLVEDVKDYFTDQGIMQAAKPLEDAWDRVVNKIKDVQLELDKLNAQNTIAMNNANAQIYNEGGGSVITDRKIREINLQAAERDYEALAKSLKENEQALKEALAIPNVGDSSEKRAQIEELRNKVREQQVELSNSASSIAKAKYDLSQDFSIEDYYRDTSRQIADFNQEIKMAGIQNQRSVEDFNLQIQNTSLQLERSNRGLIEAYRNLETDLNIQLETAKKSLLDASNKIKITELRIDALSLTPGNNNSAARQVSDFVDRFTESLFNLDSDERQIKIDILNLEKERIGRLEQIRSFEEQQFDAMREYEQTMRDLTRSRIDTQNSLTESTNNLTRKFNELGLAIERGDSITPAGQALRSGLQTPPNASQTLQGASRPTALPNVGSSQQTNGFGQATVMSLAQQYGLKPSAGAGNRFGSVRTWGKLGSNHRSGNAVDFGDREQHNPANPAKAAQQFNALVNELISSGLYVNVEELIWNGTGSPLGDYNATGGKGPFMMIKNGKIVPLTNTDTAAGHRDHLHIAETTKGGVLYNQLNPANLYPKGTKSNNKNNLQSSLNFGIPEGIELGRVAGPIETIFNELKGVFDKPTEEYKENLQNLGKPKDQRPDPVPAPPLAPIPNPPTSGQYPANSNNLPTINPNNATVAPLLKPDPLTFPTTNPNDFKVPNIPSSKEAMDEIFKEFNRPEITLPAIDWSQFPAPPIQNTSGLKQTALDLTNIGETMTELTSQGVSLEKQLAYVQLYDDIVGFRKQLEQTLLQEQRGNEDRNLAIEQLIQNSKGYLTIQEKAAQAGMAVYMDYENQLRSIADKETDLNNRLERKGEVKLALELARTRAKEQGLLVDEKQYNQEMESIMATLNNIELEKNKLATQREQLEANQAIAASQAESRDLLQSQLNLLDKLTGQAAAISSAQYSLGGTLVDEGAILQAKMQLDTVEERARLEAEANNITGEAQEQFVANAKKLAELDYKKSFKDAIPFVKELGADLKEAVLQTGDFNKVLVNLLNTMASTIFDQLVLNPFTTFVSNMVGNAFGLGQNNTKTTVTGGGSGIGSFLNLAGSFIMPAISTFGGFGASNAASAVVPSGGYTGNTVQLPAFTSAANGLDQALMTETRRTGQQSMLAVINRGESVLSTLNGDAQKYQALKRSGKWDSLSFADGTERQYNKVRRYSGRWDNLTPRSNDNRSQTINKFNQNYTIVTPNADSFRKSQSQIQDEGARTYRRKMR